MSRTRLSFTVGLCTIPILLLVAGSMLNAIQNFGLRSSVIASGETDASSSSYALQGTVGQAAVGGGSSSSYSGQGGFWPTSEPSPPQNGAPVAQADSFSTPEDSTLEVQSPGVLGNDSDPDGDSLSAALVSDAENGSLTLDSDGAFEYAPDEGFTGTDQFTYEASDGEAADTATVHIRLNGAELTRSLTLGADWNLVSVPLEVEDPTFGAVMGSLCESGFFFEAGAGYVDIADADAVPPGEGFWANCSSGTIEVTGTEPDTLSVRVEVGWNIIGPFADSVDVGSITSDPPGIVQSSFFAHDVDTGYELSSTLVSGDGYWVKASEDGTLDLSGSGDGAALAAKALAKTQASRKQSGQSGTTLRLTDASGREATLRLAETVSETQRQQASLPPVPPGGVFDVRFEGGRSVAEVGDGGSFQAIETQGLTAPVTVKLENASESQAILIRHSASETQLTAENRSAELASTDGLAVGLQGTPDEFALKKTYPNPASGRATVEYALPEQAEVTIGVYDVLGRRVETLADGPEQAGRHTVRLDAGQMSSGTYFVRMRVEDFRQTRRLTVVR